MLQLGAIRQGIKVRNKAPTKALLVNVIFNIYNQNMRAIEGECDRRLHRYAQKMRKNVNVCASYDSYSALFSSFSAPPMDRGKGMGKGGGGECRASFLG